MAKLEKKYLRGSAKQKIFEKGEFGILTLGVMVEELEELLAQINKQRAKEGEDPTKFINIKIGERREEGKYGDTHYAYVLPYQKFVKESGDDGPKEDAGSESKEDKLPWD
jgi:hypothetical protein